MYILLIFQPHQTFSNFDIASSLKLDYNYDVLRKPDGESGPGCKLRVCFLLVTSASTSKVPCSEKRPTPQQELGPGLWQFSSFLLPQTKRIAKSDTLYFDLSTISFYTRFNRLAMFLTP
nr:MAG TPA: hypothetical protein [Bacteriophage sp.]